MDIHIHTHPHIPLKNNNKTPPNQKTSFFFPHVISILLARLSEHNTKPEMAATDTDRHLSLTRMKLKRSLARAEGSEL